MDIKQALSFFSRTLNYIPEKNPIQLKHFLISKSSKLIASTTKEYTISIWNISKNEFLFKIHFKSISLSPAFTEDDKYLIIGSQGHLNFLNLELKVSTFKIEINSPINRILDFASQSKLICSTLNSQFLIIDLNDHKIQKYQLKNYASCMIKDDNFVYFGEIRGSIEKFCLKSNEILGNVCISDFRINCLCLTEDKQFLIVGNDSDFITIVKLSNLEIEKSVGFEYKRIDSVAFLDNKIIVSSRNACRQLGRMKLLECLIQYDLITEKRSIINLENFDNKLPILVHENNILYSDIKGNIRKFDIKNEKNSLLFSNYSFRFESICFDKDDEILYTGGEDGLIQIWDVNKRIITKVLDYHSFSVTCLHLSKEFGLLASGSADADVIFWDLETHLIAAKFLCHSLLVKTLAEGVESRYLVSYSNDETLCVFDMANRKFVKKIYIQADTPVSFNRIKRTRFHIEVFMICNDWKIRIWKGLGCDLD